MAWSKSGNIRGPQGPAGPPAAAAVTGQANGVEKPLTLWVGTQAQYDAIAAPNSDTVYVVKP